MDNTRDHKIDILRVIALIGIIIAHTPGNLLLLQLRNFDVPLMAMLMGMSFYLSNKNRSLNYSKYIKKRLKKLLFPTWIFLTIFFGLVYIASLGMKTPFIFNLRTIISSYFLLDGIGYVWIIGVFLVVAFLNPIILKLSTNIKKNSSYFSVLLIIYLCYLILVYLQRFMGDNLSLFYEHLVLYSIAYGIIAAIGIRFKQLNNKSIFKASMIFWGIFLIFAVLNDFAYTNIAKYPPTTYYLSYAFGVIFLLYLLLDLPVIFNAFNHKIFLFISQNSLWIYLWHIIPVYTLGIISNALPIFESSFILRFTYIIAITAALTFTQELIKKLFRK